MKKAILFLAACIFLAIPGLSQAAGTATADVLGSAYSSAGEANNVAVSGNYAYVADGENGVRVVDVSDANNPEVVNSYSLTGVNDIKISGQYAYVSADYLGLRILDISDPLNLSLAGSYDIAINEYMTTLFISGDYIYASMQDSGLLIINISDPANPTLTGTYSDRSDIENVYVGGDYAYVADQTHGFLVLDVSSPSSPSLVGSTTDFDGLSSYVAVSGDYAYVSQVCSGYYVVDISDPANPSVVYEEETEEAVIHIQIVNDYAYIVDRTEGLYVYSLANPALPTYVSLLEMGGHYKNSVTISGNYAYIGNTGNGLHVLDVSTITSPSLVSTTPISSDIKEIKVSGNYAYAFDGAGGLVAHDISDPENMQVVGSYQVFYAADLEISGQYAYLLGSYNFSIVDISDPSNMSLAGSVNLNNSEQVYIDGDYAYVASRYDATAFSIINISDPYNPELVGSYESENDYYAVLVEGNYAYVSGYGDRLSVFDVSDKSNPSLVDSKTANNPYGRDLVRVGKYIYVLDNSGLYIYNIDKKKSPKKVYSSNIESGIPVRGTLSGDYLYVTLYNNEGVVVFDVSDKNDPVELAYTDAIGTMGLAINEGVSYLGSDKLYAANIDFISEVEGIKNGKIKSTHVDGSTSKMTVFNISEKIKNTKVVHYQDDYYIVLQPRGKKFALVNINEQEVLKRETIAKKKKYPINSLKVMELQGVDFAVAISRKKSQVRVYIVKVLINNEKFGKDARLLLIDAKVTPSKSSKYKANKIKLRGSKGKLRHALKVEYSGKKYTINEE